jgi:hypothetical protein
VGRGSIPVRASHTEGRGVQAVHREFVLGIRRRGGRPTEGSWRWGKSSEARLLLRLPGFCTLPWPRRLRACARSPTRQAAAWTLAAQRPRPCAWESRSARRLTPSRGPRPARALRRLRCLGPPRQHLLPRARPAASCASHATCAWSHRSWARAEPAPCAASAPSTRLCARAACCDCRSPAPV